MRMNASANLNAADLLSNSDEEELNSIFRKYGEIKMPEDCLMRLLSFVNRAL